MSHLKLLYLFTFYSYLCKYKSLIYKHLKFEFSKVRVLAKYDENDWRRDAFSQINFS